MCILFKMHFGSIVTPIWTQGGPQGPKWVHRGPAKECQGVSGFGINLQVDFGDGRKGPQAPDCKVS